MKVSDLKRGDRIKVEDVDGNEVVVVFSHLDGMYSYSEAEDGRLLHLSRMTPLKRDGVYYVIDDLSNPIESEE